MSRIIWMQLKKNKCTVGTQTADSRQCNTMTGQQTHRTPDRLRTCHRVWVWNSASGTWQMFECRELNLILLMGSQIHVAVVMNVTEIPGILTSQDYNLVHCCCHLGCTHYKYIQSSETLTAIQRTERHISEGQQSQCRMFFYLFAGYFTTE